MRIENPQTYAQAILSLETYRNTYDSAIHLRNAGKAVHQDNEVTNTTFAYMQMQDNGDCNKEDKRAPPHAYRQPRPRVRRIKSGVEGPFVGKRAKRGSRRGGLGYAITTCDAIV